MQIFFIIFWQEILLHFAKISKILSSSLFFLITIFIFSILLKSYDLQASPKVIINLTIWFSLLISIFISCADFFKQDYEDGTLEQLIISCSNFEIVVLARIFANWIIFSLPILLLSFFVLILSQNNQENLWQTFTALVISSISLTFIFTFCGSLMMINNSFSLIAAIAFPLAIPTILIAISASEQNNENALKMCLGLFFFTISTSTIATSKVAKIALE
jgi:heme exporter protein B